MPKPNDLLPAALASVVPFTRDELLAACSFSLDELERVRAETTTDDITVTLDDPERGSRTVNIARVLNFAVVDAESADYALRLLAELTVEVDVNRRLAKAWKAQIDEWLQGQTSREVGAKVLLEEKLKRWAESKRLLDDNDKTTTLPAGRIETRWSKDPKVVVVDEEAVLVWARAELTGDQYEALVNTTETVRVTKLRELATIVKVSDDEDDQTMAAVFGDPADGATIPGTAIEIPDMSITVKPDA